MTRPDPSPRWHAALTAVQQDLVRYHNGRTGPALGYTWSESAGGQMFDEMRQTLQELRAAHLIDVETHRVFAQRGHRVRTTTAGYRLLRTWSAAPAAA
ncbi:hypothetical protein [Saccharopolyspora taberi]|uniref:ArsR family transcriptional regulator n=1 Tax=Saccharopolyspora taberi TaxID=60895 RepID=A0ABN3VDL8_9PSEU